MIEVPQLGLLLLAIGQLLEDEQKLGGQALQHLQRYRVIYVAKPFPALVRHRNLEVRPLACHVDAEAGDDGRLVLKTHGGQMETAGRHEVRSLGKVFTGCFSRTRLERD